MTLDKDDIATANEMAKTLQQSKNDELIVVGNLLAFLLKEREALAQQSNEQAELVAVMELYTDGWDLVEDIDTDWLETLPFGTRLYIHPPVPTAQPKEPEQRSVSEHLEPVGIVETIGGYPDESAHVAKWLVPYKSLKAGDKLYTTPPQRKPLTDEQLDKEFEAYAAQFDTLGDEWQDMGAGDYFKAGFKAAHGIKGDA